MLYALTEARPLDRFWDLRRDFDRLFDEAFPSIGQDQDGGSFSPEFSVDENADALILRAEVPGVEKDKLHLSLHDRVLTVEGERESKRDEASNLHRCERTFGSFSRSLRLPEYYDLNAIEAFHENGVLTVKVPKSAEAKPRRIDITPK
jgi:HSP20 family protein